MLELNKLSKEYRNFGFKLFISYIIFTIFLIIAITIIHIYFSDEQNIKQFEKEVSLQAFEKKKQFDTYFDKRRDAMLALSKNEYLLKYVELGLYRYYIDLMFLTVMDANKEYMNIRFINKDGYEMLRFNRDKFNDEPYKSSVLQDKSHRYYFKDSSLVKPNTVWISPIDLNIEYETIQKPFVPVVRMATPIYIKNEFQGVLVINIFMKDFLNNLAKSTLYDIYLIDEGGYYIKHKLSEYNWSLYDSKRSIDSDFSSDVVYKIQKTYKEASILGDNTYVQPLLIDNQHINMLFVEKDKSLEEESNNNNKMIFAILLFATFVSLIFSYLLSRPLKYMNEVAIAQSDKLHDLASNLDRKVAIESLKNAKKDRLLQHQSKLAELGDMIGNIAHQWRHPLTRLSLILQNLNAYYQKGKLNDKLLEDSMENAIHQIEFMSSTIDNFKNFYKQDTQMKDFEVNEALESVLKIIGSILEHNNIHVEINDHEHQTIYANKNEFAQVLMNLIMNSKDAFETNPVNNPLIKVDISSYQGKVRIDIEDNAGGIDESIIEQIFNPYFTTKDEKGTGIGLYLSKAIIEDKLKGKITVFNGENGAVFTILI